VSDPIPVLAAELPRVVRWAGAIARELRHHNIAVGGKASGFADTDALTLADLSVQELLVGALRDMGPVVRACRIEAEETTGDLARFADRSDWVLAIDPIDGTRDYRDRIGTRYSVMLHARNSDTVHYSMVYLPEEGPEGTWLEVRGDRIVLGPDDHTRPARAVLDALAPVAPDRSRNLRRILVSGFKGGDDAERAQAVSAAGLEGVLGGDTPGSLFPLMANGYLGGALFHTPNVYDFPVAMHLARVLGGDAIRAHDGRRADFREVWRDERSNMFRLQGIVACAVDRRVLATLVDVARGWSTERY
jgi:3'(2'), 5'-bisphosphate nucleotidase